MNLTTDRNQDVSIVRVNETRLMYPILSEFANTVTSLIGGGDRKLLLDLSTVTYVDSATIGCLMDLYRQASAAGGKTHDFDRDQCKQTTHRKPVALTGQR